MAKAQTKQELEDYEAYKQFEERAGGNLMALFFEGEQEDEPDWVPDARINPVPPGARNGGDQVHGFTSMYVLGETDVVVVTHPHQFKKGDNPMARLAEDVGFDFKRCPRVRTHDGGTQYYLFSQRDCGKTAGGTLKRYPGVEVLRSDSRAVIPAGECGYRFEPDSPKLALAPEAPDRLIRLMQSLPERDRYRPVTWADKQKAKKKKQKKK